MRKIRLVFVFTLCLLSGNIYADIFKVDNITYYVTSENATEASVAGCWSAYMPAILNIPSTISMQWQHYDVETYEEYYVTRTYQVTGIENNAFTDCSNLVKVTIPNSVTKIGNAAFAGCSSLININIPNSVRSIGSVAFGECSSLTNITIPNSVTSIGFSAFTKCTCLTKVTIPNSISIIEDATFNRCSNLTNITIPNSVTTIGTLAFSECTSLTNVTLPNSVTSIGDWAFSGCQSINYMIIPSSVNSIGIGAFCCTYPKPFKLFIMSKTPPFYQLDDDIPYYAFIPKDSYNDYMANDTWYEYLTNHSTTYAYNGFEGNLETPKLARGVTTDGSSQLFMMDFHLEENNNVHIDDEFSLWMIGKDEKRVTDDKLIIGAFGKEEVESWDGEKGYVYTAPNVFEDSKENKDSLVLRAFANAKVDNEEYICPLTNIKLYRPGVALVHGLNSDKSCFANLGKYLEENGYTSNQVQLVDYKPSHAASFYYNTYKEEVINNNLKELYGTLLDNGIVSSKYDLVGHSMGGILSRLYAQKVNKDAVHKIITLDTPHLGSQIADWGETSVIPTINNIGALCNKTIVASPVSWVLSKLTDFYDSSQNDALRDLATYSDATQDLNDASISNLKDIPCHSICSILGDENNISGENNCRYDEEKGTLVNILHFFNFFNNSKKRPIGKLILDNLFEESTHDGVVSLTSQRGGLDESHCTFEQDEYGFGPFGFGSNAHHTKTNKWIFTFENIKNLLDAKKESSLFSMGGYKQMLPGMYKKQYILRENEVPEMKILDDGKSFISVRDLSWDKSECDSISMKIESSNNIVANIAIICVGEDNYICSSNDEHPKFILSQLPLETVVEIVVIGRTENNELVFDSKEMTYEKYLEHIGEIKTNDNNSKGRYNLSGQKVNTYNNGIVISNGKKQIIK